MKNVILSIAIGIIILIATNLCQLNYWQNKTEEIQAQYNDLEAQYQVLYDGDTAIKQILQESESSLMIIAEWAAEDGYEDDVEGWWKAIQQCKNGYTDADKKFAETDGIKYATEEQIKKLENIVKEINEARNLKKLRELTQEFNSLTEEINRQKNEKITGEAEVTADAYEWNFTEETVTDNNSEGLTKASGVNYYDGRTETYYSSNVLYHYRTPEWTLDSEGFYHDDNGYYVVAASDKEQGTIFEGSKGTCIVLDSGCSAGVTDYYVAW